MKRSILFLSVISLLLLSSCSQLSDLLKVKVDTEFQITLPVTADSQPLKSAAVYPFSAQTTFNPLSQEDLAEYTNQIAAINLTDIMATVTAVSGNFILVDALLEISGKDQDGQDVSVSWTFAGVTVTEGVMLALSNAAGEYTALSALLTGLGEISVSFSGHTNTPGVTYELFNQLFAEVTVGL